MPTRCSMIYFVGHTISDTDQLYVFDQSTHGLAPLAFDLTNSRYQHPHLSPPRRYLLCSAPTQQIWQYAVVDTRSNEVIVSTPSEPLPYRVHWLGDDALLYITEHGIWSIRRDGTE